MEERSDRKYSSYYILILILILDTYRIREASHLGGRTVIVIIIVDNIEDILVLILVMLVLVLRLSIGQSHGDREHCHILGLGGGNGRGTEPHQVGSRLAL